MLIGVTVGVSLGVGEDGMVGSIVGLSVGVGGVVVVLVWVSVGAAIDVKRLHDNPESRITKKIMHGIEP
jgi:uncharacterized membrane protein YhaH (DUF805 family)